MKKVVILLGLIIFFNVVLKAQDSTNVPPDSAKIYSQLAEKAQAQAGQVTSDMQSLQSEIYAYQEQLHDKGMLRSQLLSTYWQYRTLESNYKLKSKQDSTAIKKE